MSYSMRFADRLAFQLTEIPCHPVIISLPPSHSSQVSTSRNLARRTKLASSCDDIIRNKDYRLACAGLPEMVPRPVSPTAGITRLADVTIKIMTSGFCFFDEGLK